MKLFLKMWHGRCHTHTHTLALVLLMLFSWIFGTAQGVGKFNVLAPIFDQSTGVTSCTINWESSPVDGNIPNFADRMGITVSVSGTNVCLNNESAQHPTVFHGGFAALDRSYNIANEISLAYFSGPPFMLPNPKPYQAPNTPFVVVRFRALPGEIYSVNISGWVRNNGVTSQIVASTNSGTPDGVILRGNIIKPLGFADFPCDGHFAVSDAIPNVTVSKVTPATLPCFPGIPSESVFFPFGFYEFSQASQTGTEGLYYTNYRITPSKTNATDLCCGISQSDLELFPYYFILGQAPITNAMFLAADFNGDGYVTSFDHLLMNLCVLNSPLPPSEPQYGANWLPWRFAPYATAPPGAFVQSPGAPNIPNFLDCIYDPLNGGLNVTTTDFWGVKRGDLNGTCTDCGNSFAPDTNDDRSVQIEDASDKAKLYVPENSMKANQVATIPISVESIERSSDILIELIANLEDFEVVSIENGDLSEEFAVTAKSLEHNGTAIKFAWFNMELDGVDIPDNSVLFYVKIRAKRDIQNIKGSFHLQPLGLNLLLKRWGKSKYQFEIDDSIRPGSGFSAKLIGSNLLSEPAKVLIKVPHSCAAKIIVIDGQGIQTSAISQDIPEGFSEIYIPNIPAQSGLFTIFVQSPFGQQLLRAVKL